MLISMPGKHSALEKDKPPHHHHFTLINKVLKKLSPTARGHIVAALGEFAGTIFFLFFAFAGTQVANISSNTNTGTTVVTTVAQKNPSQLLYISLSFGFSLAVNAWVFFRISGGLFNPAVTFGMWVIGSVTFGRAVLLCVVQCLGAIVAAALVSALFSGGLNVSTTLATTTSLAQGFFIEMILTAQLVFAIFMLAAEKHAGTFIAPVGIGLALFIAELTGVFWTGGSLNPARSLGPAVVQKSFPSYHWIYWLAPLVGALLAAGLYKMVKSLEYETANDPEAQHKAGLAGTKEAVEIAGGGENREPVVGGEHQAVPEMEPGRSMSMSTAGDGYAAHGNGNGLQHDGKTEIAPKHD